MKNILSWYSPRLIYCVVYMLQASEYNRSDYLKWFWRSTDLSQVSKRQRLVLTSKAKLLLAVTATLALCILIIVGAIAIYGVDSRQPAYLIIGAVILLSAPLLVVYGLIPPLWLGEVLIQKPRARKIISAASLTIESHPGYRIGIAGSYGKTTFKEALTSILSTSRDVAATPGNMNTPLGISRFVEKLSGKEEILIFELGEYYPGDIKELSELTRPNLGIITGINEAHLDKFKNLECTTDTIFELADFLKTLPVYKNGESKLVMGRVTETDPLIYSRTGVSDWRVSGVEVRINGTFFTARRGSKVIHAHSGLLGAHQIGPLVACIDIADRLGLTSAEITSGIAQTHPYEHRMQPRLVAGAWIIDDTYNGNSDGIRSGLEVLRNLEANRRVYVTPGLVEQGSQTKVVHETIGKQIAEVADVVVLIKNSVTEYMETGLRAGGFAGELKIIDDPLRFYSNLEHFVAAGDVVLLQNDWTDNYQ